MGIFHHMILLPREKNMNVHTTVHVRGHLGWCLVSIEGLFY